MHIVKLCVEGKKKKNNISNGSSTKLATKIINFLNTNPYKRFKIHGKQIGASKLDRYRCSIHNH